MADEGKKKYKKNYIRQVIYNITFELVTPVTDTLMKAYKERLGSRYGELAAVTQQGVVIQSDGSNIQASKQDQKLWQIQSTDKDHTITVTNNNFGIDFWKYEIFHEHIETISYAQEAFMEIFGKIDQINRLGLRYVNKISISGSNVNWHDYLEPELISALDFVDKGKLRRSMHSTVLAEDEETLLNINYGLYNQYFPAPILDNEFILDIDAYTSSAINPSDCSRLLEKFNKVIAIYFEKSITEKLRQQMEVIDEEEPKKG